MHVCLPTLLIISVVNAHLLLCTHIHCVFFVALESLIITYQRLALVSLQFLSEVMFSFDIYKCKRIIFLIIFSRKLTVHRYNKNKLIINIKTSYRKYILTYSSSHNTILVVIFVINLIGKFEFAHLISL